MVDTPCLGFFWSPQSDYIVLVSVDTARNLMTWSVASLDGDVDPIAEMVPTRDFGFYLRFFEQYSQSHPIISPNASHILVSGELVNEPEQSNGDVGTWEIPIDGSSPRKISDGVFAVYGPAKVG